MFYKGFPAGSESKESAFEAGDLGSIAGFDPWVGKIPWSRAWQPTPVFLPGESPRTEGPGGLQSMGSQRVGHSWATKSSSGELRKKNWRAAVLGWSDNTLRSFLTANVWLTALWRNWPLYTQEISVNRLLIWEENVNGVGISQRPC